jgi:hypothetical protein
MRQESELKVGTLVRARAFSRNVLAVVYSTTTAIDFSRASSLARYLMAVAAA